MRPIIKVAGLSKLYYINARRETDLSLRDAFAAAVRSPLRRLKQGGGAPQDTVWALKDVNLEFMPGDVVGIVGRNGAGKSTLLKILSRITEPTSGRVELYGRIGSLLEVGTGFHPELTGRENVYLNGAILGMSRKVIASKFDEIVAFAEIEKFIETPVKHYSSGMYVRLAFAVAAHMDSEILIVDEALAVGDSAFQAKCIRKMEEVAGDGRTILFVSHSMSALTYLCRTGLLFENGRLMMADDIRAVEAAYLSKGWTAKAEARWDDPAAGPSSRTARISRVRVLNKYGELAPSIDIGDPVFFEIEYHNFRAGARLVTAVHLHQVGGGCVLATDNHPLNTATQDPLGGAPHPVGVYRAVCSIPGGLLNDKQYTINVVLLWDEKVEVHTNEAVSFEVIDTSELGKHLKGEWIGSIRPKLSWATHEETQPTPLAATSALPGA